MIFQYLRDYQKAGEGHFTRACNNRIRRNGFKLVRGQVQALSHGARSQSCAVQGVSLAAPKAPPLQQIPLHICIQAFSICCHIISLLHSAVSPFSPSNSLFLSSCGIWQRVMPRISMKKKDQRQQHQFQKNFMKKRNIFSLWCLSGKRTAICPWGIFCLFWRSNHDA